jgi:hypothetical protein
MAIRTELTRVALRLFDVRRLSEVELFDEFALALPKAIELLRNGNNVVALSQFEPEILRVGSSPTTDLTAPALQTRIVGFAYADTANRPIAYVQACTFGAQARNAFEIRYQETIDPET